jgi:hypothetical protein
MDYIERQLVGCWSQPICVLGVYVEEHVLGIPAGHVGMFPYAPPEEVNGVVAMGSELASPIGLPLLVYVVFAPLTRNRRREENYPGMTDDAGHEALGCLLWEMFSDFKAQDQIEASL